MMTSPLSPPSLTGQHWIAGQGVLPDPVGFRAVAASSGQLLEPSYGNATPTQIAEACIAAQEAFAVYRRVPDETRAQLLEVLADEIMAAGESLLERCSAETALSRERLLFERQRTVNQARLFAQVVREGSWADPRIDHSQAAANTPDCRSLWLPIGPVAVFGASNFPLAISVVGNDTIAALAAGCPVVVKAHPGHPGTCEILAGCLNAAIRHCGLPGGLFSLLHGNEHRVGRELVQDPRIQAVGFTGSLSGGRALFDAVCQRPQWIPVHAEMGSVNPVFFLPSALREPAWQKWTAPLAGSITAGCGQMCTQPGLLLGVAGEGWDQLQTQVAHRVAVDHDFTLLHPGIASAFRAQVAARARHPAISQLAPSGPPAAASPTSRGPSPLDSVPDCHVQGLTFRAQLSALLADPSLEEEIFGPTTIFVECDQVEGMLEYAGQMKGSLTASIFAAESEDEMVRPLVEILQNKVGRIIFNGFPTGVQVNHAMMHGGPYPAAMGSFTSIGTGSIKRFARPVCFQQFPARLLPDSLRDDYAGSALRMVDGQYRQGSAQ